MTKVTFVPNEKTGDVGSTNVGPYKFEANKPVDITDERLLGKLRRNDSFKVEGADYKPEAEPTAEPEADDDEPSPRPRGRPPMHGR